MLECAACHRRFRETDEAPARCPACGGQLLAPPALLERRWVRWAVYGVAGTLLGLMLLVRVGTWFIAFGDRALAYFGLSPLQSSAAEQRRALDDLVQEAESSVPAYPGSARMTMRHAWNRPGTAPIVDVCWQTPAALEEVVAYYRQVIPSLPAEGRSAVVWRLRGADTPAARENRQLGAERGQLRLLVHGAADGALLDFSCPPEATYALSFTVAQSRR